VVLPQRGKLAQHPKHKFHGYPSNIMEGEDEPSAKKNIAKQQKKKMCVSSVIKVKARTPALQTAARLLLPVTLQQCNTGQEHNGCAPLSCLSA